MGALMVADRILISGDRIDARWPLWSEDMKNALRKSYAQATADKFTLKAAAGRIPVLAIAANMIPRDVTSPDAKWREYEPGPRIVSVELLLPAGMELSDLIERRES